MYILTIMWSPILLVGSSYIAGLGDPLILIPNDYLELLIFILLKYILNSHSCNFIFSSWSSSVRTVISAIVLVCLLQEAGMYAWL